MTGSGTGNGGAFFFVGELASGVSSFCSRDRSWVRGGAELSCRSTSKLVLRPMRITSCMAQKRPILCMNKCEIKTFRMNESFKFTMYIISI